MCANLLKLLVEDYIYFTVSANSRTTELLSPGWLPIINDQYQLTVLLNRSGYHLTCRTPLLLKHNLTGMIKRKTLMCLVVDGKLTLSRWVPRCISHYWQCRPFVVFIYWVRIPSSYSLNVSSSLLNVINIALLLLSLQLILVLWSHILLIIHRFGFNFYLEMWSWSMDPWMRSISWPLNWIASLVLSLVFRLA